jgi:excinuclease ABC subunit B
VTTLTKRLAEDLTDYYTDLGVRVRYLHADIGTLERMEIIQDLRKGAFDVLVGINLLREGLDLPEVSLVAILDADKEGFLRSARSLVQTFGRAARNAQGRVILYAERTTGAMEQAMAETDRRRKIQADYNRAHGITPATITKSLTTALDMFYGGQAAQKAAGVSEIVAAYASTERIEADIEALEKQMQAAVKELDFEQAAVLRDRINELKKQMVFEL